MKRLAALVLWAAAVFLCVVISQKFGEASAVFPAGPVDPLSRFLGSAKEAFGDTLFLKADVYFHGGVMDEAHHDETAEALEKEGAIEDGEGHGETAPKDWIAKINRQVQVHEVVHLSKEKRKEMLPFFAMATALDPRNVEAVLTSAYWLDKEFGKTGDALKVLEKGLRDNPDSWEIENALGRFYFRREEWAKAGRHLREALGKPSFQKAEDYEHVDLYYHLAGARLQLGKKEEALQAYLEARRFFGDKTAPFLRTQIEDKIKELSAVR